MAPISQPHGSSTPEDDSGSRDIDNIAPSQEFQKPGREPAIRALCLDTAITKTMERIVDLVPLNRLARLLTRTQLTRVTRDQGISAAATAEGEMRFRFFEHGNLTKLKIAVDTKVCAPITPSIVFDRTRYFDLVLPADR